MVKDVGVVMPPFEIEFSTVWKEIEAGLRQFFPPFTLEERIELAF